MFLNYKPDSKHHQIHIIIFTRQLWIRTLDANMHPKGNVPRGLDQPSPESDDTVLVSSFLFTKS